MEINIPFLQCAQCAILKYKYLKDQFIRIYSKSERSVSSRINCIYAQMKHFFGEKNCDLYLWTSFTTPITISMYFGSLHSSYLFILDNELTDSHK